MKPVNIYLWINNSGKRQVQIELKNPSALGEMKIALSIHGFAFLNQPKVRRGRFPPLLLPAYLIRQHSRLFWRSLTLGMLIDFVLRLSLCRPAAVSPQVAI